MSIAIPMRSEREAAWRDQASSSLAASVQRMMSRSGLNDVAAGFENGTIATKPATRASARPPSMRINRFVSRQRPRSPDRIASRDRRRMLGGSSALPPQMRSSYTEGQRAVLCIIAGEIKHHGVCGLPIDRIAALAGVCRTTVQTTLHEGRLLGHLLITERPLPGRKHLPNLITVISLEWMAWLKRGPSAHRLIGSNSPNLVSTSKSKENMKRGSLDVSTKHRREEVFRSCARGSPQRQNC
jgi:hypothetical protein